ncbi:MAG: hypothetical protein SFU86_18630 [Pirellulaceae bacterium]|nr:hypothetical protein [Pirellulaceae bacterium]
MKLEKLAKQLRRDLLANPKKGAALGLMSLVAAYFWWPLVKGFVLPGRPQPTAVAVAETSAQPLAAGSNPATAGDQTYAWSQVREQISSDKRMVSAKLDPNIADPFGGEDEPPTSENSAEHPHPMSAELTENDIDPAAAGLALTGVAVGSRRSAATINGRAYREGDTIKVQAQEDAPPLAYRLARIERQRVVLVRGGREWPLVLPEVGLLSDDVLVPR